MRDHFNKNIKSRKRTPIPARELKPGDIFSMHDSPMSLLCIYDDSMVKFDDSSDCVGNGKISKDTIVYRLDIIK